MSKIIVDDLSLKFRAYHEGATSAKEYFANLFRRTERKAYSEFWALQEVSFSISGGERVGIVGSNGAGKSTLLKTICRIYEPTIGKVSANGRIAPHLEIGAGFHPESTWRENIYFNYTNQSNSKAQQHAIEIVVFEFAVLQE